MRYVRAAVVLLAALTFSHVSYGQSRHAIAVFSGPAGGGEPPAQPGAAAPPQTGATCTIGSVCKELKRYDPTILYGIAEYNLETCKQTSPGEWSGYPSSTVLGQPITTGYYTATISVNCAGSTSDQTYLFAVMCYKWSEHNNHSNPNPSTIEHFPMDHFNATWDDKPGEAGTCTKEGPGSGWKPSGDTGPYTVPFQVYVPEVFPSGETTQGTSWNQASALFQMTLTCCNPADSGPFDFSGEEIDEEIEVISDPCGLGPPAQNMHPVVQTGNIWGPDSVGFHTCPLAQLWCAQKKCSFVYKQTVSIRNPQADPPKTSVTYSTNFQASSMAGTIKNPAFKYVIGSVASTRAGIPASPREVALGTGYKGSPPGTYFCPNLAGVPCP